MSNNSRPTDRFPNDSGSLVDVFENFLGVDISINTHKEIEKLSAQQYGELADELTRFLQLEAVNLDVDEETVCVDRTKSIDMSYYNFEKPELSIDIKKLILFYPRLVVPWTDVDISASSFGVKYMEYVASYTFHHRHLLKNRIIIPISDTNIYDNELSEISYEMSKLNASNAFAKYAHRYFPIDKKMSISIVKETLEAYLLTLYDTLSLSGQLNTSPAFTDPSLDALFRYHLRHAKLSKSINKKPNFAVSNVLTSIDIPKIDDISIQDLVSLRIQSEEFHVWRNYLGHALRKTANELHEYTDLQYLFEDNLLPLREQTEILKEQISNSSLKKFARTTTEAIFVGAASSAATYPIIEQLGGKFDLTSDIVKLLPYFGLSFVYWLLFNRASKKDRLLLKFFHSVSNE